LGIDYAVTEDDFNGAPVVPGFADDGEFWACVARLPGGKTPLATDLPSPNTKLARLWRVVRRLNGATMGPRLLLTELQVPRPDTPQPECAISGGSKTRYEREHQWTRENTSVRASSR
jgi:hypothetical protein